MQNRKLNKTSGNLTKRKKINYEFLFVMTVMCPQLVEMIGRVVDKKIGSIESEGVKR